MKFLNPNKEYTLFSWAVQGAVNPIPAVQAGRKASTLLIRWRLAFSATTKGDAEQYVQPVRARLYQPVL
jgi:hypothetical protein